jgi:hypothetical protein
MRTEEGDEEEDEGEEEPATTKTNKQTMKDDGFETHLDFAFFPLLFSSITT